MLLTHDSSCGHYGSNIEILHSKGRVEKPIFLKKKYTRNWKQGGSN